MNLNTIPTKGNLIAAKNSLALARQGFELMDRKRNILIREMMNLIDRASSIQNEIDSAYTDAYRALQQANIELGVATVQDIALSIPVEDSVRVRTRSIMGTEIPLVTCDSSWNTRPQYAFYGTRESLDAAKASFEKVKQLTVELSTVETSAIRLASNIKKTQKRANALKNITIPSYESLVKTMTEALEEKDREEFTRLKVIKSRMHS